MMESFSQLGLAESLAQALASFGFEVPTQVQSEAIPILLSRKDAIIESETGTGKTFAYLAPAFQLASTLDRKSSGDPGALIAAPTQELAVQIGRESERLAKAADLPLKTVVLLGGTPLDKQIAKLKSKPDIVVGTLGRLADLVALGRLRTSSLKLLVLDEADRLFAPETEELATALVKSAPSSCVRAMVSATIPEKQRREMRPLLREAAEICPQGDAVLSESIEHWCFYCDGRKRLDFVRRFEAAVHPERCLLFLSQASRIEKAALALDHFGLPIAAIHSGMDKEDRRVALEEFSNGEVRYLLTSDLGARGLDIQGVSHVISLDLPEEATIYTHRAGRTGRAGAKGVSVVLADGIELKRASKIATKGGFVYRCKVLEEGQVLEPTSEEFFARAADAEDQRMEAKAGKLREGEERRGKARSSKPRGGAPRDGAPRAEGVGRRDESEAREDRFVIRENRAVRKSERELAADPTEGPRSAKAPKTAPWRPAAEGEKAERSGPSLPKLRKKGSIKAEERREDTRRERPSAPAYRREEREDARGAGRASSRDRAHERGREYDRDRSDARPQRRARPEGEGGSYRRGARDDGDKKPYRSSDREQGRREDTRREDTRRDSSRPAGRGYGRSDERRGEGHSQASRGPAARGGFGSARPRDDRGSGPRQGSRPFSKDRRGAEGRPSARPFSKGKAGPKRPPRPPKA